MSDDDIQYSGTPKEYQPHIGDASKRTLPPATSQLGYHNINLLRKLLKEIIATSDAIVTVAEEELADYSLRIAPDSDLEKAQAQQWPDELGTPKDYVSYEQYKAMQQSGDRGANFIRKAYESSLRAPGGTNATDVITGVSYIKTEAKLIEGFLDNYVGNINDTAEFRTLELLQDWAQDAIQFTREFGNILQAPKQAPQTIPKSELDQVTPEDAARYEALFTLKVNALNKEITQVADGIKRDYGTVSDIYYNKFLGPALRFRLKVSDGLERISGPDTFLATQARHAESAMAIEMNSLFVDQMKRNENFGNRMRQLQNRIIVRDNYSGYVKQLTAKGGKLVNRFTKEKPSEQEKDVFNKKFKDLLEEQVDLFASDHNKLDNRNSPNAHSQYLLKDGGTITGDIDIEDGVKLAGVELPTHAHKGVNVDGTPKISGTDIEGGTLVEESVDRSSKPPKPSAVRALGVNTSTTGPGVINSEAVLQWEGEDGYMYEVQIAKV